jgi:hypothetical protein
MSEWLKETGCKLVGVSLRWFESSSAQNLYLQAVTTQIFTKSAPITSKECQEDTRVMAADEEEAL